MTKLPLQEVGHAKMAYFDNPLIPIKQQAPSAMFRLTPSIDPESVSSLKYYWNAQVDGSLFTDVAGMIPVINDDDDVKAWEPVFGNVLGAVEATDFPKYSTIGGIKSVKFDGSSLLKVANSTGEFNFMHNGDGGEIIIVAQMDTGQTTTNGLISNNAGTTNDVGFEADIFFNSGFGFLYLVSNGTGGEVVTEVNQAFGDYIDGVIHSHQATYKESETPESTLEVDGVDVGIDSGNDDTFSTSDAGTDLTFARSAAAESLSGRMYSVTFFDSLLDVETREGVTNFLLESAGALEEVKTQIFSPESTFDDFIVTNDEIFYTHPNLLYCTTHDVFVKSLSGSDIEVTVTFYAGDTVTILDEGTKVEGQFGEQFVIKIKTKNGEKNVNFNQTTINILIDDLGDDTANWVGNQVFIRTKKTVIAGKKCEVYYFVNPSWDFDEYGDLVKAGNKADYPENDGENIPF